MFASRLPEAIAPSPLAELIAQARASGDELLDLTESNPTRAGIVYPEAEILAGFQDGRSLVYNPEPFGLLEAREQVATMYGVSVDQVVLTASTSESYSWLFKLLCNPGDEVLTPSPSYPLFGLLASLESVVVRHYPLRYYRGWFLDMHALEAQITSRTRAVIVVNPNNPTGSYLKKHELAELSYLCANRQIALIADEVFTDYSLVDDPDRATELIAMRTQALVVSLNGLSKVVGLPQMKLGWMVFGGLDWLRRAALERLEMIADTYLSVGTPVQYCLPALLRARQGVQAQIVGRLKENLAWLREQVKGSAVSVLTVEGGWYATVRVPDVHSEEEWVSSLLQRYRVLVQPGYFYDFDFGAHLVLSLLTPPEVFRGGVNRIFECVQKA